MQKITLIRAGLIAALYVVLTYVLAPVSYGPMQFRISEALTVLPVLYVEAIPGLFIGTLVANMLGGLGPWDIFGGSTVTLVAAWLTYKSHSLIIALIWPIVLNAIFVSMYLSFLYNVPYWLTVVSIGISEAAVVFVVGYPLLKILQRQKI